MYGSKPKPGTPEFKQWLPERAKERADKLFNTVVAAR
jgi:hypothetical protein